MSKLDISARIETLYAEREEHVKTMDALTEKGALDEGEQKSFDDADSQINSLDLQIKNAEIVEQRQAMQHAKPVDVSGTPAGATVTPQLEQDKSLFFARQIHALFMTGGNRYAAAEYAEKQLGDQLLGKVMRMPQDVIQRAAVITGESGVSGFMEELVQVNQANMAFIELLRPMSVYARFPGRSMSFEGAGSIKIPRQTVGSTGGWVAEGDAIKVDRLTLDSVTLTPKKNGNIMAISRELAARSTPSALALVRDDLLKGIATSIDTKFVSADAEVAGTSPAGLQTFDGTPTASTGTDLNAITADLKAAIGAMLAVNMPMAAPIWLINPLRLNSLKFIRDGLGTYAFKDEIGAGNLAGYPYLESTSIPDDIVMLVDGSQIITASELAPEISISEDATVMMDDAPASPITAGSATSLWQTDSIGVRSTTRLDWGARYAECVQTITGVAW